MSRFKLSESIVDKPTQDPMNIVSAHSPTSLSRTVFRVHPTGFSKDYQLVEAYDTNWQDNWRLFMLRDAEGTLTHLDGTSGPIHQFWKTHTLRLTPKRAAHYLRFFGRFVQGGDGSFFISESPEQLAQWCGVEADHPTIQNVAKHIKPIKFKSAQTEGLVFKATVFYADGLFRATFKVMPTGMIEMLEDRPKAHDLGIREQCALL